jgi:hypothetical protein
MKAGLILALFVVGVLDTLLSQPRTQPVEIGYANVDLFWDDEPLHSYKFRNGDPIDIVSDHRQWFRNCDSRRPAVWIHSDDGERIVCLYNYYAVSDPRNITPVGFEIPSKDFLSTLEGSQRRRFPFDKAPGKYMVIDHEARKTDIVDHPYYFWTKTSHESNLDGEEMAYIGSADMKSYEVKTSTGEFCEGYPIVCFGTRPKANLDYRTLLPNKYKDLMTELRRSLVRMEWAQMNGKVTLEGYLSFNSAGMNNSEYFTMVSTQNVKSTDISFNALDNILTNWPYYPSSFGTPVAVGQKIMMGLEFTRSTLDSKEWNAKNTRDLRNGGFDFWWLDKTSIAELSNVFSKGQVKSQIEHSVIIALDGYRDTVGLQYSIAEMKFRGPSNCFLAPFGQAARLTSKFRSDKEKTIVLTTFLSIAVPVMLLSSGIVWKGYIDLQRKVDRYQPNPNMSDVRRLDDKRQEAGILSAITASLITVDLTLGAIRGHQNAKARRNFERIRRKNSSGVISCVVKKPVK